MIFTIKDYYDKSEGKDLPMFSLNGKSTTAQYIAFSCSNRKQRPEKEFVSDDEEDFQMIDGEKKVDVKAEMRIIEKSLEAEVKKIKNQNKKRLPKVDIPDGRQIRPIDYLQNAEFRRGL